MLTFTCTELTPSLIVQRQTELLVLFLETVRDQDLLAPVVPPPIAVVASPET